MTTNGRHNRLDRLEQRWPIRSRKGACPRCLNNLYTQVIIGDGPPRTCPGCDRVLGPLDGTRVVRIVPHDEDLPA